MGYLDENGLRFYHGQVVSLIDEATGEVQDQVDTLSTGKQDKLTFDSAPTAGSSNPVTSGGIKTATDGLEEKISDLKNKVNDSLYTLIGRYNLVNGWIDGKTLDTSGAIVNDSTCMVSEPIAVHAGTYEIFFTIVTAYTSVCGYDSNNDPVTPLFLNAGVARNEFRYPIVIPEGVATVRISTKKSGKVYGFIEETCIDERLEDMGQTVDYLKSALYVYRLPLSPCFFVGNAYVNGVGNYSDNTHGIASVRALAGFTNKVRVYATDSNLYFWWKPKNDGKTAMRGGENTQEFVFDGNDQLMINVMRKDGQAVTVGDLANVYMMSTKAVQDAFIAENYVKITNTNRFPDYGDTIYRYGMFDTAEQMGFMKRGLAYYRTASKPYICESETTIYCGKNSTNNTLMIVTNGTLSIITEGQHITIPANTEFIVSFKSDSTSSTNSISSASVYVVKDSAPAERILQYLSSATVTRADAAFVADGKLFTISRNNESIYSVFANGTYVVENVPLDHTPGHANNCNYANGKVYVSDWDDCTLIHVFNVDTQANALTYDKDIVIPRVSGDTEYYVTNDEKEIYFLGWKMGDSSTAQNTLCYGLYVYDGSAYVLAWEREALRPIILQGFAVQDSDFFYVESNTSYLTTAIYDLSMLTGVASASAASGTLSSNEGEAIIPIGKRTFIIVDRYGKQYIKTM